MLRAWTLLAASAAALMIGCDGGTPADPDAGSSPFAMQAAAGQVEFGRACAHCHGAAGMGDTGPRLIGLDMGALPVDPRPTAMLRTNQFHTMADVASFATVNMPLDAPGTLTAEQYYSVFAWLMQQNGFPMEEALTADNAASVTIPR